MAGQSEAVESPSLPQVGEGSTAPAPTTTTDAERVMVASQRQLMWWRFRKHKLALIAAVFVAIFYTVAILADFIAYSNPQDGNASRSYLPPQPVHWIDEQTGAFGP